MCRSNKDGGRRCPGCGGYGSAAKANGNRRLGRLARQKVVAHLKDQGLVESAKAILAAPPSLLPEFMAAMGIDAAVLGDVPMPSTHSNPPSAGVLIAAAKAEQETLSAPKISPEQAALDAAQEHLVDAENAVEEARKALARRQSQRRKLLKEIDDTFPQPAAGQLEALTEAAAAIEDAKAAHAAAKLAAAEAADDVVAAGYRIATTLPEEQRDEYCANISAEDLEALARSLNRAAASEAIAALDSGPQPALTGEIRDTSVYTPGTLLMETGSGATQVEGRLLDGGTAIHRRGSGDFLILQKRGDIYYGVAAAGGKSAAINKANRIPMLAELPELPATASELEREAYRIKCEVLTKLAAESAEHHWSTDQHQKVLHDTTADARGKLVDAVGAGPVRADIYDATKRHKALVRERAAQAAGEQARSEALASGKTDEQAQQAYQAAHRRALGTPTRGGGVIPHFDHKIPPQSLGQDKHAALWRSGIRAWGTETVDDYSVIAQRAGDLKSWGFHSTGSGVKTSSITELTTSNAKFVNDVLDSKERAALRAYTGGAYTNINAAICGRDGAKPAGSIKTAVSGIESAFDKFRDDNPNMAPMTVVRGTRVPSGWKGTPAQYLDAVFTPGARVEIGKVTSCTTRTSTATAFCGHPPYMMVIMTRDGIPVKSISNFAGEDEVIVPTQAHLRTVHIDHHGIGGKPTVYLVGEDLVAEAEETTTGTGWQKAS